MYIYIHMYIYIYIHIHTQTHNSSSSSPLARHGSRRHDALMEPPRAHSATSSYNIRGFQGKRVKRYC